MHFLQTRIMAVLLSLLLGLASCYDNDPNYPPEPEISFLNVGEVSFDGVDNDVTLYLTLQDGDGDVGTPEGKVLPVVQMAIFVIIQPILLVSMIRFTTWC